MAENGFARGPRAFAFYPIEPLPPSFDREIRSNRRRTDFGFALQKRKTMSSKTLATREQFAALLTDLVHDGHNQALRLKAAQLGLEIAIEDADPSSTVLSQTLTESLPATPNLHLARPLRHLNANAKATRKAIKVCAGTTTPSPRQALEQGLANTNCVLQQIQERIQSGQLYLAQSIVQVGLTRHPLHAGLQAIRAELDGRMQNQGLPTPIPLGFLS
jgi:hypothetical protein